MYIYMYMTPSNRNNCSNAIRADAHTLVYLDEGKSVWAMFVSNTHTTFFSLSLSLSLE